MPCSDTVMNMYVRALGQVGGRPLFVDGRFRDRFFKGFASRRSQGIQLSERERSLAVARIERHFCVLRATTKRPVFAGPGLRRHDLRHAGATWFANAGIPVHVVSDILGHASVETTRGYLHTDDSALQNTAERLNQHLRRRR